MIGKISKGADFGGLVRYLTKDGRGQVLDMRNLSADTPEAAAPEMALAASLSRRTKKPVMHLSVSYDPADTPPTDAEMRQDAAEVLAGLGLDRNQAVIVRHRDAEHPHMHIAINRVGLDGRAVSDSRSYERVENTLRQIEHSRGYSATLGRNAPEPAAGLRMAGPARTTDHRQHPVPDGVRAALLEARSWEELDGRLSTHGWRMERRQKPGQRAGALLVGPEGQKVAAGKIDRHATISRISDRIRKAETEERAQERAKAKAARDRAWTVTRTGNSAVKILTNANRQFTRRRRPGRSSSFGIGF